MKTEILCKTCNFWVDCSHDGKLHGFCLMRDLFTYTCRRECRDYAKGTPMKEKEYEEVNEKWMSKLKKKST